MNVCRAILIAWLVAMLAACSSSRKGGYYENDGPPDKQVDLSGIPDAVPRKEPLSKTGNKPYEVFGKRYVPMTSAEGFYQKGVASWYGKQFHGRRTSSGEPYDMYAMTAAHTVLPLPTYARVTNVANGKSVIVKVNDRGPFKSSRVMDLSYAAAWRLDMVRSGTALVEITAIGENTRAAAQQSGVVEQVRSGLYIQIGAFANPDAARQLQQRLNRDGYRDASVGKAVSADKQLHRVRLGPLESREQGDALLASLHASGYPQARLVNE